MNTTEAIFFGPLEDGIGYLDYLSSERDPDEEIDDLEDGIDYEEIDDLEDGIDYEDNLHSDSE